VYGAYHVRHDSSAMTVHEGVCSIVWFSLNANRSAADSAAGTNTSLYMAGSLLPEWAPRAYSLPPTISVVARLRGLGGERAVAVNLALIWPGISRCTASAATLIYSVSPSRHELPDERTPLPSKPGSDCTQPMPPQLARWSVVRGDAS